MFIFAASVTLTATVTALLRQQHFAPYLMEKVDPMLSEAVQSRSKNSSWRGGEEAPSSADVRREVFRGRSYYRGK